MPDETTAPGPEAHETDPGLLASLRSLGDQFGPLGVALAAVSLTDGRALMEALEDGNPPFGGIGATKPRGPDEPCPEHAGPPLPEGIWGRVELPGMRSHTGWITEGTRGGQCVLVVRDWEDRPLGEYILGPACRHVHLPTPQKRPEPQERAAITPGDPWAHDLDDDEDDIGYDSGGPF